MFRSIQQILDEADVLADRCEAYEPSPDDERPVAEYLLKRAASQKARCEHQIAQAVTAARADGSSWRDIRRILGEPEESLGQQDQAAYEDAAADARSGASVQVWVLLIERSLDTGADLSLYWQELDARQAARRHMESDWPAEAGPMPNDVYAAIEQFNSHRNGYEHVWLEASPIRATAYEEPGNREYEEPQKRDKIWRRDFVRDDLASSSEWSEIQDIATALVDHMNRPEVYEEVRQANVPGSKSQEIQDIIKKKTADLGFRDESKGLFAGYRTRGLTPDYYREVGCTGVILEVERGKTINNNMDFLDFWKCHICRVASFLILIVPVELRHNEKDPPTRAFHAASNRLESFFITQNYTNVWGLVLLGY